LQGRIDILRAELARRDPEGVPSVPAPEVSVVERLSEILRDGPARHRSSARHVTLGTPRGEEYRRLAADMLGEVELSDLGARTDGELSTAMGRLVRYEQQVSRRRQGLQRTADECSAEIARRYREGEAQVDDLLAISALRSEEHTSELQSREKLVCRLLLEKKTSGGGRAISERAHWKS